MLLVIGYFLHLNFVKGVHDVHCQKDKRGIK